ncbi:STAS domain-containing protein [Fulvivirga maritima]|uniref:STAS domain-containing protein n=1 Tax=Fulvivirga maritima TaxID=2904247 RepID=UPI001F3C5498|nr:STAS domain-containing protein [Fulvivirga maritima]UII26822.1 STAS domain-containing protein [Fulvivirga maritima]
MKPQVQIFDENDSLIVKIRGELTLRYAEDIKQMLAELPIYQKKVELILEEIEGVDLCAIQMIWAFRKYCQSSDIHFHMQANMEDAEQQLIDNTGFSSLFL